MGGVIMAIVPDLSDEVGEFTSITLKPFRFDRA